MKRISEKKLQAYQDRLSKRPITQEDLERIQKMSVKANRINASYRDTLNKDLDQFKYIQENLPKGKKGFSVSMNTIKNMSGVDILELENVLSNIILDKVDLRRVNKIVSERAKDLGLTRGEVRRDYSELVKSDYDYIGNKIWQLQELAYNSGYNSEDIREFYDGLKDKDDEELKAIAKEIFKVGDGQLDIKMFLENVGQDQSIWRGIND